MADELPNVVNRVSGGTAQSIVQVGVIHGDLHVGLAPSRPDGEALLVSVTALDSESETYTFEGRHRHPDSSVSLVVEAYTEQAVILHRLRPVVLRRFSPDARSDALMMSVRTFTVDLDLPPVDFNVDLAGETLERYSLERMIRRATAQPEPEGEPDFPFAVTASSPEYFRVFARHNRWDLAEWRLELDWSCLGRHGTVLIDRGDGRPFVS
ncbi:hypothetical protein AB0K51_32825 [Kitasatospora sp. NPDC049285]|uniref:hypothetical protein n=1 Tax=Kitasatospora sp. NPDC049285 TaxID=3157096 RepID=UPI003436291A